ncbi:MAG: DUF3095 domain-containing protein [Deltaproteobacteria bacterium]|jgi:hypothetical protein|nr:DUF3095 domain-containing protein [Deltaproteobacteria bacterium]MBT6434113.1 DUF3095 domain-containing protein [Deltaproteobacteria bacterium]MBT6489839.1 DUF3095 domain-containing protein [Deltaproteobacteria bacterium]
MSITETFYTQMPCFTEFSKSFDASNYHAAPRNWWVIITDVKGSTKAIENGRYQDVNTIGAATIASLQNVMAQEAFPFAFGGDGATAIIPDYKKQEAENELCALRTLAESNFGLGLRVGMVSVAELEDEGLPVLVGKYELQSRYPMAVFRGGALTRAEAKVKESEEKYGVACHGNNATDLSKLSCRWQPLKSQNGKIITLLVQALHKDKVATYLQFTKKLEAIMGGNLETANPVNPEKMRYRSLSKMLTAEKRFQRSFLSLLGRMATIVMAWMIFATNLFKLIPSMRRYMDENPSHSDYKKFDEMLRMVLDCSQFQINAIEKLCEEQFAKGTIHYGIHCSHEALMTCYVPTMNAGEHIHFIDGGDGGYAMAAKQLKAQAKV